MNSFEPADDQSLEMRLQATADAVPKARRAVGAFAAEHGLDRGRVELAVAEAVANAVLHGFLEGAPGEVVVRAWVPGRHLRVESGEISKSRKRGSRDSNPGSRLLADTTDFSLRDSHFRAIVDSSDDAIITKDAERTITSWNRGAERIYGYSADEAIGQPISILVPPHRSGEEREILKRVFAGERIEHYETERVTKAGGSVVVSLTVSAVRDDSGEVIAASVIARDITERRRSLDQAARLHRLTSLLSKELTPDRAIAVLLAEALPALGAITPPSAPRIRTRTRRSGHRMPKATAGCPPAGARCPSAAPVS